MTVRDNDYGGVRRVKLGKLKRWMAGATAIACAVSVTTSVPMALAQDVPPQPPRPLPGEEPTVAPEPIKPAPARPPTRPLPLGGRRDLRGRKVPAAPGAEPEKDPLDVVPPGAKPNEPPPEIPRFETGIEFKPTPPGARITFNLEDAELTDLVRLISSITGKAFILPNKSRSIKATVYAPQKVSAAEAYRAFLSILELNGLALVPSGRYLKIVESQGVEAKTIPLLIDQNVPPEDRFVTALHRVDSVSAEDVANLLARFKSPEGNVTAYAPTNSLIITDTGNNIRRMLRIVEAIDVERGGEQLWIEPVHYANASDLASRLTEIFPTEKGGAASTGPTRAPTPKRAKPPAGQPAPAGASPETVGTRATGFRVTNILPDERTNSLIIMATESAYLRILELIRHLDVPLDGDGGIHVHYLQHGDAEEVAKTLTALIGTASKPASGGKGAAAAGAGPGTTVFEGSIAVTAHAPTNSLVITSSLHDYASLKRVIDRLDSERRQVFIEAVVLNLDVSKQSNVGLSYFSGIPDFPKDGSVGVGGFQGASSAATGLPGLLGGITAAGGGGADALSGLALGIQGPAIEGGPAGLSIPSFGVAMAAIANTGDGDLLATPHLLALNNEEAEINIGQNVPLQGSVVGGLGGLTGLAGLGGAAGGQGAAGAAGALGALGGLGGLGGALGGSPPRGDVGTRIRITPHINESDEIRLEIEEEISDVGAPVQGNVGAVPINRRTAKTQVVVRDQQTVVIGGLIRDAVTRSENKIPLLGDIPLIGYLFRSVKSTKSKQNLLLFLTPYIVRSQADLRAIYERKMRERQEFLDRYFLFGQHEYRPTIEYSRTRGLVAEMMKQMKLVTVDKQMAAELANKPPLEHIPRPAIGAFSGRDPGPSEGGDTVIEGGEVEPGEGGEIPPPPPLPEPAVEPPPAPEAQ
jgi:general secretion pathway protein D